MHDELDKTAWLRSLPSSGPAWNAAIDFGIDVSLIEHALSLGYEERFRESLAMTRLALELEAAGKQLHGPTK